MYLSRLLLSHRSHRVLREIEQPHEMHRTLMSAFGQARQANEARKAFEVLFRVDANSHERKVVVYVQSAVEPDWQAIQSMNGYLRQVPDGTPNPATREIDSLIQSVAVGRAYSFRLRANPTKRRSDNGKRVGLYKEDEQVEWLHRKAKDGGFRVMRLTVAPEGVLQGRKHDGGERHALRHHSVRFDGLLVVTGEEEFKSTIVMGIGSGKAYGFGLLSLGAAPR